MILCILGRQPALGLAELEAVFGAETVQRLGNEAALIDTAPEKITHDNLGGVIKISELISTLPAATWSDVAKHCRQQLPHFFSTFPDGKLTIGISAYGLNTDARHISQLALELKKILKAASRAVRVVPNNGTVLNSAQVWHNNLTGESGAEIILAARHGRTYIGRTISVQDVDSYAQRDFERPKRDARVGMLPPKLAQTMLNLAHPTPESTILDPFCGTGVVLMEAALQGYNVIGSDINQRMVEYTETNLAWLHDTSHFPSRVIQVEQGDATIHQWKQSFSAVVSEVYLGRPLTALPDRQTLQTIIHDCDTIIRKFLGNLHPQLAPNTRCCIAVPAWKTAGDFIHLPVVDDLKRIGYNRIRFSHARHEELIYHRSDQVVARELLVLTPCQR